MAIIIATLTCFLPAADVVVIDMTKPMQSPRLIPLRKPLAALAQWPRIGDEVRAGAQLAGDSGYTLWLRGNKSFGEERLGGQIAWSP